MTSSSLKRQSRADFIQMHLQTDFGFNDKKYSFTHCFNRLVFFQRHLYILWASRNNFFRLGNARVCADVSVYALMCVCARRIRYVRSFAFVGRFKSNFHASHKHTQIHVTYTQRDTPRIHFEAKQDDLIFLLSLSKSNKKV